MATLLRGGARLSSRWKCRVGLQILRSKADDTVQVLVVKLEVDGWCGVNVLSTLMNDVSEDTYGR